MARHATRFDPVSVEAEHTMFIMYTSGTTAGGANPIGIKHCTAGYLLYVALTHQVRICGRCIGVVLRINFLHAVCVRLQDWGCVWMYGRSWVDYWALLCGVWASVQWRHHGPV